METLVHFYGTVVFCFPCKFSPSSRLPPAVTACCCVVGCQFFSAWRSDAQAGQEEGTHYDPEGQPRYKHGWWRSHLESAPLNALRDKAFYCPSAPEERRGEERRGESEKSQKMCISQKNTSVQVQRVPTNQRLQSIQFDFIRPEYTPTWKHAWSKHIVRLKPWILNWDLGEN